MKNVVIFYNHINREYKAYDMLKAELEAKNVKVFLFSIGFEYYKAIAILHKIKIDMVIFPGIYSVSDYEGAMPFLQANRQVYIVSMYTEQILSVNTQDSIFVPDEMLNNIIHFVWSQSIKDRLIHRSTMENLIFINCNIRSDLAKHNSSLKTKNELAKEFNIDPNKKWLLFSEGRNAMQFIGVEAKVNLQELCNISYDVIDKAIEVNIKSMKLTLEEFDKLSDDFFEKYELIYRPHPSSNISYSVNKRVKAIYKYSIYDWLANVDANIVWNSTSAFEADMMGLPIFICEHIDNLDDARPYGLERYKKIQLISEINDELLDEVKKALIDENIYEEYLGKVDGKCIERTCDAVLEILNNGLEGYKPAFYNYNKTLYYKKIAYGIITNIMVKLKLFNVLKYPATAYNVKTDIPFIRGNIS